MKNYLLLLAIATPLVLGSCGKDDDEAQEATPQENPVTTTLSDLTAGSSDPAAIQLTSEILTSTKWKLSGLHQTAENTIIYKDLYTKFPSCQKDDLFEFSVNGNSLTVTDGLNFCNATPQPKTGNWHLTNSANLTISANNLPAGLTGAFNIIQLSETEMVLKQNTNGTIYLATFEKHIPSRFELLMNKNWRITAETEQSNGSSPINIYANMPACEKDNFIRFESNNQLRLDEGPSKCNASDPQNNTLIYYFNGGSNITVNSQGTQQQYYIQVLDATTLIMQTYYYNSQGYVNNTVTYTSF